MRKLQNKTPRSGGFGRFCAQFFSKWDHGWAWKPSDNCTDLCRWQRKCCSWLKGAQTCCHHKGLRAEPQAELQQGEGHVTTDWALTTRVRAKGEDGQDVSSPLGHFTFTVTLWFAGQVDIYSPVFRCGNRGSSPKSQRSGLHLCISKGLCFCFCFLTKALYIP